MMDDSGAIFRNAAGREAMLKDFKDLCVRTKVEFDSFAALPNDRLKKLVRSGPSPKSRPNFF
jgi:hypothetical protein